MIGSSENANDYMRDYGFKSCSKRETGLDPGTYYRIDANPEIGFKEIQASRWISEFLTEEGFRVENGICDLPTSFSARAGSGPLHVAICAEYDALPEIGHACGHNIIAWIN